MKMRFLAAVVILVLTAVGGASSAPDGQSLYLAGPAELRPVMLEMAAEYGKSSGMPVQTIFYNEAAALERPEFLSARPGVLLADSSTLERAVQTGKVSGTGSHTIFFQRLALGVRDKNPKLIFTLNDASRPGIRLGIVHPRAGDLGAATKALLDREDSSGALRANVVFQSDSAHALAAALASGDVDAVVGWDTMQALYPDKIVLMRLAGDRARPLAAGILKTASPDAAARRLAEFVAAESARKIYERHGYSLVADSASEARESDFYRNFHRHKFFYVYQLLAQQLVDDYGIREGIALDIGCGGSQTMIHMARLTQLQFVGLDIEPDILNVAQQNVAAAGFRDRFRFLAGDAHHMPLPDDYAHLIVSRGSIPFWHDRAMAMREIYRVLKPGGVAFVGIGGPRYLTDDYYRKIQAPWLVVERREWLNIPDARNLEEVMAKTGIPAAHYKIIRDGGHWVEMRK